MHCLAPGGVDFTSSAGKITMNVIIAVAQFERDLLIERTQAGLARAKAQGKPLGRPTALSADQKRTVREKSENGRDDLGHRPPVQRQQTNHHAHQRSGLIKCRLRYLCGIDPMMLCLLARGAVAGCVANA